MSEEYIPDYTRYKSADLLDVYSRIDRHRSQKDYDALVAEIKRRFHIEGDVDFSDEKVASEIIRELGKEEKEKLKEKGYFLELKLAWLFLTAILALVLIQRFYYQNKKLTMIMIALMSFFFFANFFMSLQSGIIEFAGIGGRIYKEEKPTTFLIFQILYLLSALIFMLITLDYIL